MITVSIRSIKNYCSINLTELNDPSYSIQQLVFLVKKTKSSQLALRNYFDKILSAANHLIYILNVLSMLSEEYHNPMDKKYIGEINLFKKILNFISGKWGDNEFTLEKRKKYYKIAKLYNDVVRSNKKNSNIANTYYNLSVDICRESIIYWIDIFYSEFKKYCRIGDNENYTFVLENEYLQYFKNSLIDAGDINQKKLIDSVINEFKEVIVTINNITIDTNLSSKYFKINEKCNKDIDWRIKLFEILENDDKYKNIIKNDKYNNLKIIFSALEKLKNKNKKFYLEYNKDTKKYIWNETQILFTILIMQLTYETFETKFWAPFEEALNLKLRGSAKNYICNTNPKSNKKNLNMVKDLIKKIYEYNIKDEIIKMPLLIKK